LARGIVVGGGLAAMGLSAYAPADAKAMAAEARFQQRVQTRAQQHDPHGSEDQIDVIPVFDLVTQTTGGASAEFHIEVDSLRPFDVQTNYAWHVVDDTGQVLATGRAPKVEVLAANGTYTGDTFTLPTLKNGYYRVVFTVVTAGDKASQGTTAIRDWWLQVVVGSLQEVTETEWYEKSRATLAKKVTP
jgi:hypothetical protein